MRLLTSFLLALAPAVGFFPTLALGQDWTNNSTAPITPAPAPWTLRGTVYSITLLPASAELPAKAYPPLERKSATFTQGEYVGILGMIQIIRYTESPVGPYDELLIVPGYFKNQRDGETLKRVRVSRIYVSQKYTAWNGRINWNIPKHLARFDWTDNGAGVTTVKVYPYDTTGDVAESAPAPKPWFQMKFSDTVTGLVNIPFTTDLYKYIGINATLVQPPLPGNTLAAYDELPASDHWAATVPGQTSTHTTLGVFDMDQGDGDVEEGQSVNSVGDEYFPNFWPGLPRFNVGLRLADARITFSAPEIWS
ncbi:hypothetical protein F5Y17DRAFT_440000 [Xylariaceae sp. FL0594]|nr:hypothetical protein F5Y17DRAFT_440000 [Xylariaceae sp. FL0594]